MRKAQALLGLESYRLAAVVCQEGLKLDAFHPALRKASEAATQGMLKDLLTGVHCTATWMDSQVHVQCTFGQCSPHERTCMLFGALQDSMPCCSACGKAGLTSVLVRNSRTVVFCVAEHPLDATAMPVCTYCPYNQVGLDQLQIRV